MSYIEVKNLKKYFPVNRGLTKRTLSYVKAVDDVSFAIEKGSTLAVVGESGSGKTTLARTMLRLTKATDGEITIGDKSFLQIRGRELRSQRSAVSVVFQNPAASLNPQATIGASLMRPQQVKGVSQKQAREKALHMLELVQLDGSYFSRMPHQLSGGQQQRVSIARALIVEPSLMILDEPTSALDVSVQSQILNLLLELQISLGLTYVFITHDLNVVRYMADDIVVMYLGKVMEQGNVDHIFDHPAHPYTRGLIDSMPVLHPGRRRAQKRRLEGEIGSLVNMNDGCRLFDRCPYKEDVCRSNPAVCEVEPGHYALCHFPQVTGAGQ